ncbi:hypothetical protein [Streptomyces sp. NPDC057582]|uniref:hypothetical protein n=1 Tax=Streptomyces sp. NPDC057582 TaxID=3346174 RepID=UPI003677BE09
MKVGAARSAATRWVAEHARPEPGFRGAYFSGSTVGLPDDAELSPSSDVDIVVVLAGDEPPVKPGKLRFRGALLEITYVAWADLSSVDEVLASYHLAGSFRHDTVIADPTGRLRALHAAVSPRFAERPWVRRRCEDALHRIESRLAAFDTSAPFHEQVTGWLFPTGVTTHVLLVAALRNPTVRQHLSELTRTFDATAAVARTPFFFSSDLTAQARPIAVDGSRLLVDRGDHREAVFWIIATFARCHTVLAADAPGLHTARMPAFRAAVADLGITSTDDLLRRGAEVGRFLPRLRRTAEEILESASG